jgi:hypothetical protein
MRAILDMDTVQIEITNACVKSCSNCTRFCGHHDKTYFMTFDQFKQAVDSLEGFPKMIGFQGGEPLLHPEFEKFCEYAKSKFPKEQLGLWSTFPKGYEHYREIICATFYHVLLNDHTRNDIMHHPVLVSAEEVLPERNLMWYRIDHCWAQESWSASINPHGAFFCEIAASFSMLLNGVEGWCVNKEWWWKTPKDFKEQIEEFCPKCGFPVPLKRRASVDGMDDISPNMLEKLKYSKKIKKGLFQIHDLKMSNDPWDMQSYKDMEYRQGIANRYDMFLTINEFNFWQPHLRKRRTV